mgnify:CR=1 FL=1
MGFDFMTNNWGSRLDFGFLWKPHIYCYSERSLSCFKKILVAKLAMTYFNMTDLLQDYHIQVYY